MFDQTFVTGPAQTRKPWTVAISLGAQILFVIVILILPLLHIAALHAPERTTIWMPLQVPPQPPRPQAETRAPQIRRRSATAIFVAPRTVPARIDMTPEIAAPEVGPVIGSAPAGNLAALTAGTVIEPPKPAPAQIQKAPAPPSPPVRISGGAQAARLIFAPKPAYPALAKAARVQGIVKLQAVIARDGTIKNLQLVSGPPLLVATALEAVRQWRYQPTLLSAEPVEVATEIDVNFTLSQ
ncbi:MAG TPA: TonB family protein [Bryobacteraceae bacterium]|jgi:protein TonB|nr:TonB family protein [Bryobacteraceae bacterium]